MKTFSFGCFFLALVFLASCDAPQSKAPVAFNQRGIVFQHPGDWSVGEVEKEDSTAVSVTCEKDGLDDSGLITISYFRDSLDLSQVQEVYQQQLGSVSTHKLGGVKFTPPQPGRLGPRETLQSTFTMSLLGVAHTGFLDAFSYKGHTVMVLRQQADEDSTKNRPGFALITQTLDFK